MKTYLAFTAIGFISGIAIGNLLWPAEEPVRIADLQIPVEEPFLSEPLIGTTPHFTFGFESTAVRKAQLFPEGYLVRSSDRPEADLPFELALQNRLKEKDWPFICDVFADAFESFCPPEPDRSVNERINATLHWGQSLAQAAACKEVLKLAQSNPAEAMRQIRERGDSPFEWEFVKVVSMVWHHRDPEAAKKWLVSEPNTKLQQMIQAQWSNE